MSRSLPLAAVLLSVATTALFAAEPRSVEKPVRLGWAGIEAGDYVLVSRTPEREGEPLSRILRQKEGTRAKVTVEKDVLVVRFEGTEQPVRLARNTHRNARGEIKPLTRDRASNTSLATVTRTGEQLRLGFGVLYRGGFVLERVKAE